MHGFRLAFFVAITCVSYLQAGDIKPPNIVFIIADDLGWTDLGCCGSKYYQTPNLDRLRQQGMQFTSAYTNGPNCAPTRACLMSGLYSPRHGIYTVGSGARGLAKNRRMIPAPNNTILAPTFATLAEMLKAAGYVTAHFGKWHLGQPGSAGPREQGFDYNFGGNKSGSPRGGYFSPYKNRQLPNGPKGENLTDRLSQEAVKFINKHKSEPFFLYMAYYAVHTPIQAKADLTAKYAKRKPHRGHRNPKYAAMIETMDTGIGRILTTLDKLKLTDNTLVIFYSDNGGVGGYRAMGILGGLEITSQFPLRGGKGTLYEGGVRVPMIVRWPGVTKAGSTCATPIISVDFYPTLVEIAKGKRPKLLDGESLVPLFKDANAKLKRDALYWHFPGYLQATVKKGSWRTTPAGSIRVGDWKLIEYFEDGRLELYNLKDDIGQKNDIAKKNVDKRDELHRRLKQWRREVRAPMPKQKDKLAPGPQAKKITVGFVTNNPADFWNYAEAGCRKAAQDFNVNVVFRRPAIGTQKRQHQVIQDFLTQNVQALTVCTIDPRNQTPYLRRIGKMIPLLTCDNDAPNSKRHCYIGTDNYQAGRAAGQLIKQALPAGGTVALFVGMMEPLNAQRRRQGILDVLASKKNAKGKVLGKYHVLGTYTDNVFLERAKRNAETVLTSLGPEIRKGKGVCLVGLWAYNPPAIYAAVKARNLENRVQIVGFDEDAATLAGITKGHIYGTVVQQPFQMGYQAVKIMAGLARGDRSVLPKQGTIAAIPHLIITNKNVAVFRRQMKTWLAGNANVAK